MAQDIFSPDEIRQEFNLRVEKERQNPQNSAIMSLCRDLRRATAAVHAAGLDVAIEFLPVVDEVLAAEIFSRKTHPQERFGVYMMGLIRVGQAQIPFCIGYEESKSGAIHTLGILLTDTRLPHGEGKRTAVHLPLNEQESLKTIQSNLITLASGYFTANNDIESVIAEMQSGIHSALKTSSRISLQTPHK